MYMEAGSPLVRCPPVQSSAYNNQLPFMLPTPITGTFSISASVLPIRCDIIKETLFSQIDAVLLHNPLTSQGKLCLLLVLEGWRK